MTHPRLSSEYISEQGERLLSLPLISTFHRSPAVGRLTSQRISVGNITFLSSLGQQPSLQSERGRTVGIDFALWVFLGPRAEFPARIQNKFTSQHHLLPEQDISCRIYPLAP